MEEENKNQDLAEIAKNMKEGGLYAYHTEVLGDLEALKSLIEDYDVIDALKHSPLRKNEEFVLSMIRWNPLVIKDIPELNQNREFMLKAVRVDKHALPRAADELLQDPEFMVEVIATTPGIEGFSVVRRFMENPANKKAVEDKMFDIKCEELHNLKEEKRKMSEIGKELDEKIARKREEIAALRGISHEQDGETRE